MSSGKMRAPLLSGVGKAKSADLDEGREIDSDLFKRNWRTLLTTRGSNQL